MNCRLFLFAIFWLYQPLTQAAETILAFDSDIIIAEDASMIVTETIQVKTESNKIKRGIYRDFPTDYQDRLGNRYQVGFEILDVSRDGLSEPFHTEKRSNGIRIYIGDKDTLLPHDIYTYRLRYQTNRQLGFFQDFDELYWNVTGNDWQFPILKASATVHLPEFFFPDALQLQAYTGRTGEQGQNYRAESLNVHTAYFQSTQTLQVKEGLTIVVGFPKGVVQEPDMTTLASYLLNDNKEYLYGFAGLLVLLSYFLVVWSKVGKDPEAGVIIPLYEPPSGFSPASIRYIRQHGYDHKTFAAAIINLAVKGYLKIDETRKHKFILHKLKSIAPLAAGEKTLYQHLFKYNQDSIELDRANHKIISAALNAHEKHLALNYEKLYFLNNSGYLWPGFLIAIALLVVMTLSTPGQEQRSIVLFFIFWLSFWTIGVYTLVMVTISNWRDFFTERSASNLSKAVLISLFSLPFIAGEIAGIYILATQGSAAIAIFLPLTILINFLFYQWLKTPTLAGRNLLDKAEGFKLYLGVAEKDELNFKHPPEKTPELFEMYLPYALAMDIEQVWSDKFSSILNQASIDNNYNPHWYSNHTGHNYSNFGVVAAGLGMGISSVIASSSTAPGSSSGGGGGGSSGGGGGGGGGGGW